MFRTFSAAVAAAFLATMTSPASADAVDASAFTCQELTESLSSPDKDTQYGGVALLAWLSGYNATDEQAPQRENSCRSSSW